MITLLSLGCFNCLCSLGCIWQGHWAACERQKVFRDGKAKSLHSLGLPASQVHCPALWQTVSSTTICYQLLSAELMYGLSVASYPGQVGQKKWPDIHHSLHMWCFLGGPHTELKLWPIQFTWCKAVVIGYWATFGCSWRQNYMYHRFNGNSLLPLIWGDQWTSTMKIASCSCHSVMLQLTNAWLIPESKELDASSASFPQSMVVGSHP